MAVNLGFCWHLPLSLGIMHGCAESVEALVLPATEFRRLTLLRLVTLLRCWFVALLRLHAYVTPGVFSVTTGMRVCTGLRELAVRTGPQHDVKLLERAEVSRYFSRGHEFDSRVPLRKDPVSVMVSRLRVPCLRGRPSSHFRS